MTKTPTPDWAAIEGDVVERIRALAATMSDTCDAPAELKAKIWSDLIQPNVELLAEFCANITFEDAGRGGVEGCAFPDDRKAK